MNANVPIAQVELSRLRRMYQQHRDWQRRAADSDGRVALTDRAIEQRQNELFDAAGRVRRLLDLDADAPAGLDGVRRVIDAADAALRRNGGGPA